MGKRSTIKGYWRASGATEASGSGSPAPAIAVVPVVLAITGLDATLAAAGILTGKYLPIGAIPLRVEVNSAATGGTNPLLDVGLELATPDDDGLADGVDITTDVSATMGSGGGVLLGTALTEFAEVTVSDGGGTNATGGTFDLFITYTFDDDGVANN
jgi:hypothetical protein